MFAVYTIIAMVHMIMMKSYYDVKYNIEYIQRVCYLHGPQLLMVSFQCTWVTIFEPQLSECKRVLNSFNSTQNHGYVYTSHTFLTLGI